MVTSTATASMACRGPCGNSSLMRERGIRSGLRRPGNAVLDGAVHEQDAEDHRRVSRSVAVAVSLEGELVRLRDEDLGRAARLPSGDQVDDVEHVERTHH